MKKILFMVILLTGITKAKHACAQHNPNMVFDIHAEKFTRQFTVELDRGNKMKISVTAMSDFSYISNIDSIIKVFNNDIMLVKDSLLPAIMSRRIDYNMDVAKIKKMRIIKNMPAGNYFAFINGSPALLKMQQDTIRFFGKIPAQRPGRSKYNSQKHYFCVEFYLNDLDDLAGYKDGRLNEKIRIIRQHYRENWQYREDELLQLKNYPEITSGTGKGYIFQPKFFSLKRSVEVQNYKDHFIPSISCTPAYVMETDFIRREIGVSMEAHLSFERVNSASTGTHTSLFTGIEYNVIPLRGIRSRLKIYPSVSIAYLLRRSDLLYDEHSFRLGLGSFNFGGFSTRIQPVIYFNNFLKNITPSLRIVQRF